MTQRIRDVRDDETHDPIENGKYSFVVREDGSCALFRHGQPWIEEPQGAKALIAAFAELRELRRVKPLDLSVQASVYADAAAWLSKISGDEEQLDRAASLLKKRAEQCREVFVERQQRRAGENHGRFGSPPGPDRVQELDRALRQAEDELKTKKFIYERQGGSTHVQLWTRYCKHTASAGYEGRAWRCFSLGSGIDRSLVTARDALRTAIAVLDMASCTETPPNGEKETLFGVRYGVDEDTVSAVLGKPNLGPCAVPSDPEQPSALPCVCCGGYGCRNGCGEHAGT